MEIEQIKPIGKKNERFYIMLSSGEKVVLHGLTLLKTKLKVGDDINKETLEEYQCKGAYGIVMNCNTGAVLAMASLPDYDCNEPYKITYNKTKKDIKK